MFFEDWHSVWRVAVVGFLGYIAVVVLLRLSGKRTLSKMDPFDFVITAALGELLAHVMLSKEAPLLNGVVGFAVLIGLQYVVTLLARRTTVVRRMIKSKPALLFYRGEFMHDTMKREHVPEVEILAAVREEGIGDLEEVEAIVLEADSGFSVIKRSERKTGSALSDVQPTAR